MQGIEKRCCSESYWFCDPPVGTSLIVPTCGGMGGGPIKAMSTLHRIFPCGMVGCLTGRGRQSRHCMIIYAKRELHHRLYRLFHPAESSILCIRPAPEANRRRIGVTASVSCIWLWSGRRALLPVPFQAPSRNLCRSSRPRSACPGWSIASSASGKPLHKPGLLL